MPLTPSPLRHRFESEPDEQPRSRFNGSVMKSLSLVLIAGLLFAAWRLAGPASASAWYDNVDQATTVAAQKRKPILAYFTADWCGPCQQFKRDVLADSEVKKTLESSFVLVKIDLTQQGGENGRVAQQLGVRSIPTFIIYDADGRHLDTRSGGMPGEVFRQWLDDAAAKAR